MLFAMAAAPLVAKIQEDYRSGLAIVNKDDTIGMYDTQVNAKSIGRDSSGKAGDPTLRPDDAASGTGKAERPSWRQSEIDAAKDFSDYKPQVSYMKIADGTPEQVSYGTKGSTRPDYYKSGYSVDIKNYDVTTSNGRRNLIRNIEKQYYQRLKNQPNPTKQTIIIDIRGQSISSEMLDFLYTNITKRTGDNIELIFKTH